MTHRSHRREMIMRSMAFFVEPSLLYHVQWWIRLRGNQESAMHGSVLRQSDRRRSTLSLVVLSTNVVPTISGQLVRASRERAALVSDRTRVMSCGDREPATSCRSSYKSAFLSFSARFVGAYATMRVVFPCRCSKRASSMRSFIGRQLMSAFRVFLDMARATPAWPTLP